MNERRFVVSDVLWQRLKSHLPGTVFASGLVAGAHRLAVARSATCLWPLEQPVLAVSPVGQVRCIRESFQSDE